MKRILSILAGAALVFGVAGNAAASFQSGTFMTMVTDGTNELVVGLDNDSLGGLDNNVVSNIFNQDLSFFTEADSFSDLTIGGVAERTYNNSLNYNLWFAVTDAADATTVGSGSASAIVTGIRGLGNNAQGTGDVQIDTLANNGLTNSITVGTWGILTGATVTTDLSALDAWTLGEVVSVSLDIITAANDYYGIAGHWTNWTDTNADLIISRLADGSITAELQVVPIPGALVLLGSGLLAMVGIRRKNA